MMKWTVKEVVPKFNKKGEPTKSTKTGIQARDIKFNENPFYWMLWYSVTLNVGDVVEVDVEEQQDEKYGLKRGIKSIKVVEASTATVADSVKQPAPPAQPTQADNLKAMEAGVKAAYSEEDKATFRLKDEMQAKESILKSVSGIVSAMVTAGMIKEPSEVEYRLKVAFNESLRVVNPEYRGFEINPETVPF